MLGTKIEGHDLEAILVRNSSFVGATTNRVIIPCAYAQQGRVIDLSVILSVYRARVWVPAARGVLPLTFIMIIGILFRSVTIP